MFEKEFECVEMHRKGLWRLPNVVGIGVGNKERLGEASGEPAVVVLVTKKLPAERLRAKDMVPQMLSGSVTDVLEVGELRLLPDKPGGEKEQETQETQETMADDNPRTQRYRPAPGGVSIGHYRITAGTLGAAVRDRNSGELLILSNNHVLANITDGSDGRASAGDDILQPGNYDGGDRGADVIARLERFVPIHKAEGTPQCAIANRVQRSVNAVLKRVKPDYKMRFTRVNESENLADCAVAKPIDQDVLLPEIMEIGRITGTVEAEVGMEVVKSGRTSGVSRGSVKVLNASVRVGLGDAGSAVFTNQIITTPIAQPGDSGSLVVTEESKAVALLFAGSDQATVVAPIQTVMDLLDIDVVL